MMDVHRIEPPFALQRKPSPVRVNSRPPLVTSEKSNVVHANGKVRTRDITSRYKSAIAPAPVTAMATARQSSSPSSGRTSPAEAQKRSQSVERKRPSSTPSTRPSTPTSRHPSPSSRLPVSSPSSRSSTPSASPRSTTPVRDSLADTRNSSRGSIGGRDGLWPSMRSLSTSFQSESTSKRDRMARNPSPDATLKSSANAASERRRSPLRGRNVSDQSENSRPTENSHTRMIDQHRWPGIGKISANAMSRSVDLTDRVNRSTSLSHPIRGVSPTRRLPLSDTVGSCLHRSVNEAPRRVTSEGTKVLERETSSSHGSERPQSTTRPSRTQSVPVTGLHRPSSPSKIRPMSTSASRGMQSPSRTRPSTPVSPSRTRPSTPVSPSRTRPSTPVSPTSSPANRTGVSSSVFNYIADVRTGKKSANHMEDAHQLRLLYNRDLQWRFVNAQAEAALSTQKTIAEITYLEEWISLEKEHSSCVSGAFEALKASTLRLPVTGGAKGDVRSVKNAVSSAVDVMQAMGSSICYLLSRVEGTDNLVSELCDVAAKERALLDECRELLASATAMQVQDCSLRAHVMQLRQDVA